MSSLGLAVAIVASLAAQPASALECLVFQDIGTSGMLEITEGLDVAKTYRPGEAPKIYELGFCGTGLVGRCVISRTAPDDALQTIVPIYGQTYGKGDPGDPMYEFLIVNGVQYYGAACGVS